MSEWITNTKTTPGCPDELVGVEVEVEFDDGDRVTDRANSWRICWSTEYPVHIVRYRILDRPQAPNKEQVGGDHYKSLSIQPWDAMEVWLTPEQFQGYLLGSAIKYLGRYNADKQGKGGMEDVKKAIHFLNKLVQVKGGE